MISGARRKSSMVSNSGETAIHQSRLFSENEYGQQVADLASHADDVCADRVRADLVERASGDAENVECFGRLGAVARVGSYQRTRRVEFARQPLDPIVFAHLRVIAEPERTRDFGERRRVTLAVLPQVESRQMQAEDRHLPRS